MIGSSVDWNLFRRELQEMEYPPNHHFDPETFEPLTHMAYRIENLQKYAPEMMAGGASFLDIGANKGFISFYLREKYGRIIAYEPVGRFVDFCRRLQSAHGIANIDFRVGNLWDIPLSATSEVVYAGHLNHHAFDFEVRNNREPFDCMRRMARLALRYLIVDGPFSFDDVTARGVAEKGCWPEDRRAMFTVEGHAGAIGDRFDLVRRGPSGRPEGTGQREILVFRAR